MATSTILYHPYLSGPKGLHSNNDNNLTQKSYGLLSQLSSWASFWSPFPPSAAIGASGSNKLTYGTNKQHQNASNITIPRKRKMTHAMDIIDYSRETDVRTRTNYYQTVTQAKQRPQPKDSNSFVYDKSNMLKVHQITIRKLQAQQGSSKESVNRTRRQHGRPCKLSISNLIHIRHVWDQIDRLMTSETNMENESALSKNHHVPPSKRFPLYTDRVYFMTQKKITSSTFLASSTTSATVTSTGMRRQRNRASFALSTLVYTTATHQNDTTLEIIRILPTISTIKNYSQQRHENYIQHYYNTTAKRNVPTIDTKYMHVKDDDNDDDDIPLGTLRYIHH